MVKFSGEKNLIQWNCHEQRIKEAKLALVNYDKNLCHRLISSYLLSFEERESRRVKNTGSYRSSLAVLRH